VSCHFRFSLSAALLHRCGRSSLFLVFAKVPDTALLFSNSTKSKPEYKRKSLGAPLRSGAAHKSHLSMRIPAFSAFATIET
jgi:hypothetical protein